MNIKLILGEGETMFRRGKEEGQALAEYHILFPLGVLVASLMLPALAAVGRNALCEVAQGFNSSICVEVEVPTRGPHGNEPEGCLVRNHADGISQCEASPACALTEVGINHGTFINHNPDPLQSFVIQVDGKVFTYYPGVTNDGCYMVV